MPHSSGSRGTSELPEAGRLISSGSSGMLRAPRGSFHVVPVCVHVCPLVHVCMHTLRLALHFADHQCQCGHVQQDRTAM